MADTLDILGRVDPQVKLDLIDPTIGYLTSLKGNQSGRPRSNLSEAQAKEFLNNTLLGKADPYAVVLDERAKWAVGQLQQKLAQSIPAGFDIEGFRSRSGIPANMTEGQIVDLALRVKDDIITKYQKRLGGEPLPGEVTAIFNNLSNQGFQYGYSTKAASDAIETSISNLRPKFAAVKTAKQQAESLGLELPDDVVNSALAVATTTEDAQQLLAAGIKNLQEQRVGEFQGGIRSQGEQDINELEQSLMGSGKQFFERDIAPLIREQLGALGLRDSGELASSLASAAGRISREREGVISPLRYAQKSGAIERTYADLLRGALESGQGLSEATNFVRNLYSQGQQFGFQAGQGNETRAAENEMARLNAAFQLALKPRTQEPSTLDYFLQFGLPFLGGLGQAGLTAYGMSKKKDDGTGTGTGMTLTSNYGTSKSM